MFENIKSVKSKLFFPIQTMKFDVKYFTMSKSFQVCVHLHVGNLNFLTFLNSYSFNFSNKTILNEHLILNTYVTITNSLKIANDAIYCCSMSKKHNFYKV